MEIGTYWWYCDCKYEIYRKDLEKIKWDIKYHLATCPKARVYKYPDKENNDYSI